MPAPTDTSIQRGGEWLLESPRAEHVFTPERLTEEHRLIARTAEEFVDNEVLPALDRLEQKDWALSRQLLRRCGDLGLLGVDVPEAYGGVGLDKVSSLIVSDRFARAASFHAAMGAQANLTVTPLYLFGTEIQKQKYLPRLLSGELVGAYALSESGSGSDALGAKTRAARQADGSFVLNGEKMWITNGGFADVFIVFAKVDGEHFTAFIVERAFGGLTSGKEEHKMGLHGSSTTPVILQDVKVPAGNLLGEIGKGHKVAFNVLNFGRFKLGAGCSGGAQCAIGESATYAAERRQFGQPIASFGAIRHKLGEMIARAYAVESLVYRTAGLIDARIDAAPHDAADGSAALAALEEYAIEASIAKVAGSETLNFVLDENIQIHGGNGYVRDYPAERHFRDARVNRIFEGTNEINRLLIPGMLARRAVKGPLPIIAAARALQDELLGPAPPADPRRLAPRRRAPRDRGVQENRADGAGPGDADVWRESRRPAGSGDALRGYPDRRLQRRERHPSGTGGRRGEPAGRLSARGRRAGLRQRRGDARRGVGAAGAGRDGRRRHAQDDAGGAPPAVQGRADQHCRLAEDDWPTRRWRRAGTSSRVRAAGRAGGTCAAR